MARKLRTEAETADERKLRYKKQRVENEKKAREARKKEKEENRQDERRLFFLSRTIKALGYTQKEIAERIGLTQQTMSWVFSVKDDCRLSLAQTMLESVGYSLGVRIHKEKTPKISYKEAKSGINEGVRFVIEGDIVDQEIVRKYPAYIRDCASDKRLYFLSQYLQQVGNNVTEISQKTKLDITIIRYMFEHDDVKIAQLFNIARETGGEIIWTINKMK